MVVSSTTHAELAARLREAGYGYGAAIDRGGALDLAGVWVLTEPMLAGDRRRLEAAWDYAGYGDPEQGCHGSHQGGRYDHLRRAAVKVARGLGLALLGALAWIGGVSLGHVVWSYFGLV